jgi:hypothetical protein
VFKYTAAGVADGTETLTNEFSSWFIDGTANLEMQGALKQVTFKQNYGYKNNLLINPNFTQFNGSNFDGWTAYGVTTEQRVYDADGNKYVLLNGFENGTVVNDVTQPQRLKYMMSAPISVNAASDLFNISLQYAVMGSPKNSASVFFGLYLNGDDDKDYTLKAYVYNNDGTREIRYRFVEKPFAYPAPVRAHVNKYGNFLFSATYSAVADRITAYPGNEITEHFEETRIIAEGGIPVSGTIRVYLFAAQPNDSTVVGACFRNIKLFISDQNEQQLPTTAEFTLINSAKNNHVPEDVEVLNADGPDIPNALTVYNGIFTDASSGEPTATWTIDGTGASYSWLELQARFMASHIRNASQVLKVRLANVLPTAALVFEDDVNTGNRFVEAGIVWDFHNAAIDGTFLSISDLDLTGFTIEETTGYEPPVNSESSSTAQSTGSAANTDERVKLINPLDFNLLEQAGYLDAAYFTAYIDPETGRCMLTPANKIKNIQSGLVTNIASHTVEIEFTQEFESIPVGVPNLKIYRYEAFEGAYILQDVLFTYPSTTWLTVTGFTITIDPSETLSGIILEYTFLESNYVPNEED